MTFEHIWQKKRNTNPARGLLNRVECVCECAIAGSADVLWFGQCFWRTHRSRGSWHPPFPDAFHLPVTLLMGLKKSFQRAIHVWWSYWFSPPSSLDVSFHRSTFRSLCIKLRCHYFSMWMHQHLATSTCLWPIPRPLCISQVVTIFQLWKSQLIFS